MKFEIAGNNTKKLVEYLKRSNRRACLTANSAIYALKDDGEIVYIGKALSYIHALNRVRFHIDSGKNFDSWSMAFVPADQLDKIETALIKELKPKYNVTHCKKETWEPMWSMDEKVEFALNEILEITETFSIGDLFDYMSKKFPDNVFSFESVKYAFNRIKKRFSLVALNRSTRPGSRCTYTVGR